MPPAGFEPACKSSLFSIRARTGARTPRACPGAHEHETRLLVDGFRAGDVCSSHIGTSVDRVSPPGRAQSWEAASFCGIRGPAVAAEDVE
jgi:hypothetical protein